MAAFTVDNVPTNYKIFQIKDLLNEIQYSESRGAVKEKYLENVIQAINQTRKYKWVQFFQLVDVFYVVVELSPLSKSKTTKKEIEDHYKFEPDEDYHEEENTGPIIKDNFKSKKQFPWKK